MGDHEGDTPGKFDPDEAVKGMKRGNPRKPEPMDLGISPEEREAARAFARIAGWKEAIPARFQGALLSHVVEDVRGPLERWVQAASNDGVNLLITGPVGAGKSYAAAAAVRPLFFGGCSLLFTPMEGLLSMLDWKNPDKARNERRLATVDLLVMDDLGTQRENAWAQEMIYGVVNSRWMEDLPTVGTTNLGADDLRDALGERTYSRLTGALVGVKIGGGDRRREGRR